MSWRNQGITGSNNIPLGKRRFPGDTEPDEEPVQESDAPRGRDPEPRSEADGTRRRKKRNRWGDASENKAAGLMGLPTAILSNMTSEQLEAYTLHLRIEEISQKLRIDDVVPADGDRYGLDRAVIPPFLPAFSFPSRTSAEGNLYSQETGHHHLPLNTTTMADVSTLENTDTAKSSKTSVTS